MARRSDHTREELKELMTVAGLAIIEAQGLEGFSARKVAAQVGYTVGTVYNVFGTHDDLVLAMCARTLDHWFAYLQNAVGKAQGRAALHALAIAYIDYSHGNMNTWQALFAHKLAEQRAIPEWYAHKLGGFFTLTEQAVLPLVKTPKAAHEAARVLWAGIHGIAILSVGGKLDLVGADAAHALARDFLDNYLTGLEGRVS